MYLLDRVCGMLLDETPLFEPSLLLELDWSCNTVSFSPSISPSNPGEGLVLRPLCTADFNRGESVQQFSDECLHYKNLIFVFIIHQ